MVFIHVAWQVQECYSLLRTKTAIMSCSFQKLFQYLIVKLLIIYIRLMYSYRKRWSPKQPSRRRHFLKLIILKRAPLRSKILG